ncbi:MAG: transglycosylase SLT domain-containing protein [Gammaproteobacteria bacterium]|nr:transglycosylase SLT domain-containing protein [Gammaproteobacteria bacterium]
MIHLHKLSALILAAVCTAAAPVCADEALRSERQRYLEAQKALRKGNLSQYRLLLATLSDYPLYPYLLYDYLRPRLVQIDSDEVVAFLRNHADMPAAEELRADFLKLLARRQQWETLLEVYVPQADVEMRCFQLLARLRLGKEEYLMEDARSVWLSGESQPPQCDPVFARLEHSGLLIEDTIWARIKLAMEKGNLSLAQWLSRRLTPADQAWFARWLDLHRNPGRLSGTSGWPDTELTRNILLHAANRLTQQDVGRSWAAWLSLRGTYAFTPEQIGAAEYAMTLRAAQTGHKLSRELLSQLDNEHVDEKLFHERVVLALREQDWNALLDWTTGIPPAADEIRGPWLYWRGRALESTGQSEEARDYFQRAAQQRDYYGFSAFDRLGSPYILNHSPLPEDPETRNQVLRTPGVQRAHELFAIGQYTLARSEWSHALENMTSYQMQTAATLAHSWGWYDRALVTLNRAESYDDLVVRFPMAYRDGLEKHAGQRDLDLAWVFSLVRQESAFVEDARSSAGALGLMQVMPATGRQTARVLGWKNFSPAQLTQSTTNIPIGTAYLHQMLNHFDGNIVLATAAYNAGPGNVSRWLPPSGCSEPDMWIEQIPFTETRKYVQRILYFASIYDWRLGNDVTPIRERSAPVRRRGEELVASLGCGAESTASAG